MAKIIFKSYNGDEQTIEGTEGHSVMEAAIAHQIRGIDGDCGGAVACGTCHVYVESGWLAKIGEASADEREMLSLNDGARENSRLSCQITLSAALDGLVVSMPEGQH